MHNMIFSKINQIKLIENSVNNNGGFKLPAMIGFNVVDHRSSRYSSKPALASKSVPKAALYAPDHQNGSYGYTKPLYFNVKPFTLKTIVIVELLHTLN